MKARYLSSLKKQQGVALIVVLLLLALMTAVAAQMSERLFVQFHRAENQVNHQQAYWYSLGVEALAKVAIEQSLEDSKTVNLNQAWATEEQAYPLDYGEAVGSVLDRQACFNINALSAIKANPDVSQRPFLVQFWQRLLEEEGVDNYLSEVIADSSWEFVDPNTQTGSMMGVEDSTYESFQPAYLPPNAWVADSSEIRAINGVSGDIFDKIKSYVCALPTSDWYLNVNTLKVDQAPILVALFSPSLALSDAKAVLEDRPYDGWASVNDFLAESAISAIDKTVKDKAKAYLAIDSQYFELDAQIFVEPSRVRVRTLLYSKDKKEVTVVRRRYGGISERVSDNKVQ